MFVLFLGLCRFSKVFLILSKKDSGFEYKKNVAYLHNDIFFMPKNKKAWSSWNVILDKHDLSKNCVTYWLNKLQN